MKDSLDDTITDVTTAQILYTFTITICQILTFGYPWSFNPGPTHIKNECRKVTLCNSAEVHNCNGPNLMGNGISLLGGLAEILFLHFCGS